MELSWRGQEQEEVCWEARQFKTTEKQAIWPDGDSPINAFGKKAAMSEAAWIWAGGKQEEKASKQEAPRPRAGIPKPEDMAQYWVCAHANGAHTEPVSLPRHRSAKPERLGTIALGMVLCKHVFHIAVLVC